MGDFLDIYTEQEWDCIATVFFIDTAHNIADYIERIYYILRPGGLWVGSMNSTLINYKSISYRLIMVHYFTISRTSQGKNRWNYVGKK